MMNRTEAERLAVLEVQIKHVTEANKEMADALKQALKQIGDMRDEQAAMFNQLRGGKLALGVMLATASGVGASAMWFFKEFLPMLARGH